MVGRFMFLYHYISITFAAFSLAFMHEPQNMGHKQPDSGELCSVQHFTSPFPLYVTSHPSSASPFSATYNIKYHFYGEGGPSVCGGTRIFRGPILGDQNLFQEEGPAFFVHSAQYVSSTLLWRGGP